MKFKEEIQLFINNESVDKLRVKAWDQYGYFLFGSDINSAIELNDLQVGFLNLLSDKYIKIIVPLITLNV